VSATIQVVTDGEQAIRFIDEVDREPSKPCPALVILDINLPKKTGNEVLLHLRNSQRCRNAIVVIASSSDSSVERQNLMKLGADAYFRKPSEYEAYLKLGGLVRNSLA
jgi:DNA-binding response OmpR family regulator